MTDQIPNPFMDKAKYPFKTKLPEGTWRKIDRDPSSVRTPVIDLDQRPDGVWELPK